MPKAKKIIVVTGGAGFIGSNLIQLLINKTNFRIISIDNYSTGKKKNHIKNKRIRYIKGYTKTLILGDSSVADIATMLTTEL